MVTIRVKGGTPEEGSSRCVSCPLGTVRSALRFWNRKLLPPGWALPTRSLHKVLPIATVAFPVSIPWKRSVGCCYRSPPAVASASLRQRNFGELEGDDADIVPATAYDGEQNESSRKNSSW